MGDFLHKAYDEALEKLSSISNDELDSMIEELESENFDKESEDMQQAYLSKLDEILQVLKDREKWDTSSQEKGYLHNHIVDIKDTCPISRLTVGELKSIIEDVVRREISHLNYYPSVPQPAWYGPNLPPWKSNEVWCSDHTEMKTPNITTETKITGITKEQIND